MRRQFSGRTHANIRRRDVVRVAVLNDANEILLQKEDFRTVRDPGKPVISGPIWVMPGGGVEPGESHETAAIRELWEETGIAVDAVGPWIWSREKLLVINDRELIMDERYYLVRVNYSEASRANLTGSEADSLLEHRWWSLEQIRATSEIIAPAGLASYLAPLIDGKLPSEPITIAT